MVLLQTVHQEICDIFSQSGRRSQRFVVGKWQVGPGGIPYLEDAPAVFCTVEQEIEHGTHTLIVANVQDVIVSEVCAPLVYMSGRNVQLHGQA
jgi:flavin reductase (DIM6/NTAB) family NADH-FMN oxidoreductase RutF